MSKIYVDVEGIEHSAFHKLRDAHARYMAFEESGGEESVHEVREALTLAKNEGERTKYLALRLPENEKSALLINLVNDFRDEFVSGTEHGLDGYLSTRVRHGTLSGQLRSPSQAAHLVTQRDAVTGRYQASELWGRRIAPHDDVLAARIGILLARFSEAFDTLVEQVRSEWVRVRRNDAAVGLFDFRIQEPLLRLIASHLHSRSSLEDFVHVLTTYMWKLLDENLEVIRPKLASDLGSEIEAMLLQLETDLAQCAPPSGRGCAAARSSNCGDRDAVARIVEWFRLPTQTPHRSYPLAVADDVAIETVNRYYPSYRLAPNVAIPEDLFMPGVTLTAWVDVFFIFLENVVKHSHTAEPRDLSISASETDSAVTISVVNEIALGVRCAATDAAIARTQADLDRGDYSSAVLKEGGSGFLKVRKIVEHDLGDVIRFDVGYYREEQQDYFSVVLTVGKDV